MALRKHFPDGNLTFFSVFLDLCNDINFIVVFFLGYAVSAADDDGMREVIQKGRWYNLIIGKNIKYGATT